MQTETDRLDTCMEERVHSGCKCFPYKGITISAYCNLEPRSLSAMEFLVPEPLLSWVMGILEEILVRCTKKAYSPK